MIHFRNYENDFDLETFYAGFFGSIFALLGCTASIAAFATGGPYGPISALSCTQSVLNVIIDAARYKQFLSPIEIGGVAIGLLGALILTIPEPIYNICYLITRCKWP